MRDQEANRVRNKKLTRKNSRKEKRSKRATLGKERVLSATIDEKKVNAHAEGERRDRVFKTDK